MATKKSSFTMTKEERAILNDRVKQLRAAVKEDKRLTTKSYLKKYGPSPVVTPEKLSINLNQKSASDWATLLKKARMLKNTGKYGTGWGSGSTADTALARIGKSMGIYGSLS
jgi:hypothetical protein